MGNNRVEHFSGHASSGGVNVTDTASSVIMEDANANANANASFQVHRVCLPPHTTTFQKLRHRLSEIFFPDDPLHRFNHNQTFFTKFILGLQFFFPIFHWAPNYTLKLLRSDIVSGLTIASLAIPQVYIYI